LCVTWYTSFKLSLRDLVIIMADRGIPVTHTTILRWVQRYLPEFEKRWRRYARPIGGSWRMDETYIKVHGQWVCLYRAVAKAGQTVDFFSQPEPGCERRQIISAQRKEEHSRTHEDHIGRLCGLAPGGAGDAGRR
jgi:transposase-like protein